MISDDFSFILESYQDHVKSSRSISIKRFYFLVVPWHSKVYQYCGKWFLRLLLSCKEKHV